jgi:hypothetical protein
VSLRAGTQKNLLVDRMRGNLVDTLKKTQQLANSKFVSAEDVPIKKMATVKNSKMSIDAGRRIRDLLAADVQPPFVTEILGCQRSSSH